MQGRIDLTMVSLLYFVYRILELMEWHPLRNHARKSLRHAQTSCFFREWSRSFLRSWPTTFVKAS